MADPECEFHPGVRVLPDSAGYWYCPDCDDEMYAARVNKGPAPQPPEAL